MASVGNIRRGERTSANGSSESSISSVQTGVAHQEDEDEDVCEGDWGSPARSAIRADALMMMTRLVAVVPSHSIVSHVPCRADAHPPANVSPSSPHHRCEQII